MISGWAMPNGLLFPLTHTSIVRVFPSALCSVWMWPIPKPPKVKCVHSRSLTFYLLIGYLGFTIRAIVVCQLQLQRCCYLQFKLRSSQGSTAIQVQVRHLLLQYLPPIQLSLPSQRMSLPFQWLSNPCRTRMSRGYTYGTLNVASL